MISRKNLDLTMTDYRSLFPITRKYAYFNHAAISPFSTRVADAIAGVAREISTEGTNAWGKWYARYDKVRELAARLIGARERNIAYMRNTSDGISAVANGLAWKSGDNVVSCNSEFPANIYPWMRLEKYGVELRLAEEHNGRVDTDELLSLVSDRTRVVTVSFVQFATGQRMDLKTIGQFCRERGIFFFVDAIQGLGGLRLDVAECCIDACAADSHKYLLGPEGIALLYLSDAALQQVEPMSVGWMSVKGWNEHTEYKLEYREGALSFESGTLNTVGIYGLGASLEMLLEIGMEMIEPRVTGNSKKISDALVQRGYKIVSSRREEEISGIVACTHPAHTARELRRRLNAAGVAVSDRAGRLRIASHFYNNDEDIDRLLAALP